MTVIQRIAVVLLVKVRDVKVSRPAWSLDHFFGLAVIGLGLMKYSSRVSYMLVSWSQSDHLLS